METGTAHGWTVTPHPRGGYQWSAYGPRGGQAGWSKDEESARSLALRSLESVKRPYTERGAPLSATPDP